MRRLADGALWNERLAAGLLSGPDIDAMAEHLAALHREAAIATACCPLADAPSLLNPEQITIPR